MGGGQVKLTVHRAEQLEKKDLGGKVAFTFTACPILLGPLSFCHFLGFWSTYRGPFDHFSTALEICYMIATRILKIDLEIAEIIEVKVVAF